MLLLIVLVVHIYIVTRPKPLSSDTRGIIRIDFKQDITNGDATKIVDWLYKQKGVENANCNSDGDFAVALMHPGVYDPDKLVANMQISLNYKCIRFIPTQQQMQSGCPVATTSWTYKFYNYFSHI